MRISDWSSDVCSSDLVTIAGESAGGLSVIALLASPMARGLFDKAITQSGYMPSYRALHEETLGLPSAEVAGAALAEAADVATAAGLRATDPVALSKAGVPTGSTEAHTLNSRN